MNKKNQKTIILLTLYSLEFLKLILQYWMRASYTITQLFAYITRHSHVESYLRILLDHVKKITSVLKYSSSYIKQTVITIPSIVIWPFSSSCVLLTTNVGKTKLYLNPARIHAYYISGLPLTWSNCTGIRNISIHKYIT